MYQNFDGEKKQSGWMPWAVGILCVLFLIATGLAIFFAADNGGGSSSSSSGSSSVSGQCTSAACIELANEILSSIDDTVDPCDDFFAYACGNWQEEYDWHLVDDDAYNQFYVVTNNEMETFLDALYYDTNNSLVNHSSVLKSRDFYTSCLDSDVDEESIETSDLLQEFISVVSFSDNTASSWDSASQKGFNDAMAWLSIRGWNFLFTTNIFPSTIGNFPWLVQNYEIWLSYNSTAFKEVVTSTYVPLYQSLFNLSESEASSMGDSVANLADEIYDISTATYTYYDLSYMLSYELGVAMFNNISLVFDDNDVLNLTKILLETYDVDTFTYMLYYKTGVSFFKSLATLLESTTPQVVQYFLFTDVFTYALNFESSYEQSRYIDRVEFCYYQSLSQFPFIYGYMLYHTSFGAKKYNQIYNLVQNVSTNGIRVGINDATWIVDDSSLDASIKKIDYLGIYVGLPPKITEYDSLDTYYASVTQSKDDFVGNLGELVDFTATVTQMTMAGTLTDLITPWPSDIFGDSSSYDSWLTGINAFYVPSGNFFTIPVTISQTPFFNVDYPPAINYGGLGSVIGHEISHGFDPSGSYYNYNGSYGDIWTSDTRAAYDETSDCFVTQYNGLEIETGVYVNGTRTITENVADNGGLTASYYAWSTYVEENGDDYTLPGVDLSSTQLFFWAWAHAWCEAYRPGYYDGWTDVHSPNPARVWGVVQNSDVFADAYSCKSGDKMNPSDKCVLW